MISIYVGDSRDVVRRILNNQLASSDRHLHDKSRKVQRPLLADDGG